MNKHYLLLSLLFLVSFSACKKDDGSVDYNKVENFYRSVSVIDIEVAYEPGAEPYTTLINGDNIWLFTKTNIEALFDGRDLAVNVTVPANLSAMQQIPDQNRDNYSAQDVVNLANRYRRGANTETSGNIFVVFLDGYFFQDDTLRTNVLGVNVTGTSITAIFKPVITNAGALPTQKSYIEQNTVVHEIGHGLGLVNNGAPLTNSHHDDEHGSHCTNRDCVMYWLNEGVSSLSSFVGQNGMSQFKVVFGPECLQDTRSYYP